MVNEGGLDAISIVRTYSPTSKLLPHKAIIKAHFQSNPPHTVSEASFEIEHLYFALSRLPILNLLAKNLF